MSLIVNIVGTRSIHVCANVHTAGKLINVSVVSLMQLQVDRSFFLRS